MAEHYVGEIRMFGGDYAPRDWALCDGKLVPIEQYELLFNLILTTYGGDGQTNFALPDLRGRVPVHRGQGPGISQNYKLGDKLGTEVVWIGEQEMPTHTHLFQASTGAGNNPNPANAVIGSPPAVSLFKGREAPDTKLPPAMVQPVGGGQPHANRMPYLAVSYIIALNGIFPPHG